MNFTSSDFEPWHMLAPVEFGWALSPSSHLSLSSTPVSLTSEDSSNRENLDTSTGRSLSTSVELFASQPSRRSTVMTPTGNYQGQQRLMNMYGRRILESPTPNLNSDQNHSNEIVLKIGTPSKIVLNEEGWMISRLMCLLEATSPSEESLQILWNQLRSNEKLSFFGEELEVVKVEERGMKPVLMRTQRILGLNFGMVTEIMNTLSSMNFEVVLMSPICLDGSTDTQLLLKLKVPQLSWPQGRFGLLVTSTQDFGTLI